MNNILSGQLSWYLFHTVCDIICMVFNWEMYCMAQCEWGRGSYCGGSIAVLAADCNPQASQARLTPHSLGASHLARCHSQRSVTALQKSGHTSLFLIHTVAIPPL